MRSLSERASDAPLEDTINILGLFRSPGRHRTVSFWLSVVAPKEREYDDVALPSVDALGFDTLMCVCVCVSVFVVVVDY